MTCAQCGSAAVLPTEVDDATDEGRFTERYECEHCGAQGWIRGREQDPSEEWSRTGPAFEESEV